MAGPRAVLLLNLFHRCFHRNPPSERIKWRALLLVLVSMARVKQNRSAPDIQTSLWVERWRLSALPLHRYQMEVFCFQGKRVLLC
jgi:hypothetical protein